ncbi:polysaccharide deacetylase family protein [Frigoriflavimonas asaccharolytica]|uniref:Peptidoglycan/xylan/chitin deacetylase (PgdA/CDA1 family) n=1 Tax=Frigoriflavimonas asaccharolytica TaxID=2735899 RepID=A0A8J8G597_9FLAO|nr:polysaccharide deacetylase family protein [Frigoriflavimonas asaccharolytica]NRS91526.1 peptidoglycan/xylan/chitin deacetylase (PgdA/CDA1 family) [Frigoriflavimonas asaccharolytica]
MKKFSATEPKVKILVGFAVLFASAISYHFLKSNVGDQKKIATMKSSHKDEEKIKKDAKDNYVENPEIVDERRTLYFTFDDGPNNGTDNLIKIIDEAKIPVTTFIVAKHAKSSSFQKKMYEQLEADSLFEIANHSYSHAKNQYSEFYKNPENVLADFRNAKDSLNLKTKIVRTPGRNIWRMKNVNSTDIKSSKSAADLLYKDGFKVVGWDLEWRPTKDMKLAEDHKVMIANIDSIFKNNLEKTSKHLVILTHDQYLRDENSVKELKLLIASLQKSKKYQFKKISEYPEIRGILD